MIDILVTDLLRDEDMKLKPYLCPAGKLTVGVGRNLEDVGITEAEATLLLANDIKRTRAELDRALPWWRDLPYPWQRGLTNMAFNLGLTRLLDFKLMLAALKTGDGETAAREALDSTWAREQVGIRAKRIAALYRKPKL